MKVTVTIGRDDKGAFHVIHGPDEDPNGHRDLLRNVTTAGGKIGKGKDALHLVEAVTVHTTKGKLGGRKF